MLIPTDAFPVLFDDRYRHLYSLHMKYTPPLPPCMTQAHAATVVGNLATSRQSVCEALANENTIASLVGLLVDAGASAFESSGGRDLLQQCRLRGGQRLRLLDERLGGRRSSGGCP